MFKMFRGMFSNDLSIDLGTANTLIYVKDQGIVLDEPSVVAIRLDKNGAGKSVAAVGHEAKQMLGKTPGNIQAIRPYERWGHCRFFILQKKCCNILSNRYTIITFYALVRACWFVCPCCSTQVERRAIRESAQGAGARDVFLIDEPMAAAIRCRYAGF